MLIELFCNLNFQQSIILNFLSNRWIKLSLLKKIRNFRKYCSLFIITGYFFLILKITVLAPVAIIVAVFGTNSHFRICFVTLMASVGISLQLALARGPRPPPIYSCDYYIIPFMFYNFLFSLPKRWEKILRRHNSV